MEEENLAGVVCDALKIENRTPELSDWNEMIDKIKHPTKHVTIALCGKYTALHDAYISVVEALKHGGIYNHAVVDIKWIDSEKITDENAAAYLKDAHGLLVPGGFGDRGIDGMISAIRYARENSLPFLGICLGMQMAIIEYARNICGLAKADSVEFTPDTEDPVIALMRDQEGVTDIGGTLRLGAYPCMLKEDSKAFKLYQSNMISERHRHRYEVNNDYVEMLELPDHPFFIATQAHPEFKSRPNRPHPLFKGLVEAAVKRGEKQ